MAESENRSWSNLCSDNIFLILENLGLIEFLAFRGTCHNWRLASSSMAENLKKELPHWAPWLLCQESIDKELCTMHHLNSKSKFRMNLPELVGTIILGSFEGWLLLHNPESEKVFFFSPFSREKMCLPNLHQPELCPHSMAALSSSPTSPDRTICLISRQDEWHLSFYLLRPEAKSWDKVTTPSWSKVMGMLNDAIYLKGKFFFFNKVRNIAVWVNIESLQVGMYKPPAPVAVDPDQEAGNNHNQLVVHPNQETGNNCDSQKSYISKGKYMESVKKCFSMEETAESPAAVHIWGTQWYDRKGTKIHFLNESNVEYDLLLNLSSKHLQRGVWIQPRCIP